MGDALARICQAFTWRRAGTVFILCLILSTQVLAQPDLFEHWSLERIVEGWSYYLAEVCLTGFAMLAGFALADSTSAADGPRRAVAVGIALPASAALGYALAVALLYSPGFSVLSTQFVGDTLRMSVLGGAVAFIYMMRRGADTAGQPTVVARRHLFKQTPKPAADGGESSRTFFSTLGQCSVCNETEAESGARCSASRPNQAAPPQMRGARSTPGRRPNSRGRTLKCSVRAWANDCSSRSTYR
jgi:hypothetical protein